MIRNIQIQICDNLKKQKLLRSEWTGLTSPDDYYRTDTYALQLQIDFPVETLNPRDTFSK